MTAKKKPVKKSATAKPARKAALARATNTAPAIYVLIGPNLNMLGLREPEIYGHTTLDDIEGVMQAATTALGHPLVFRQSNHEGDLVTWIQTAMTECAGLIINAGAYTHTSIAIHDALRLLSCPIIEVHGTNVFAREEFRHHSYISPLADAVICGAGAHGYLLALHHLEYILENEIA